MFKNETRKAVIFAPFWGQSNHIGNYRIDRFVRWLSEDGYEIVIVRAGVSDGERSQPWGLEITVKDPLGLYPDMTGSTVPFPSRKPNKFRRWLAYSLFNPDPSVIWAKRVAKNPNVLKTMKGARFMLASSPPESSHVALYLLWKQTNVPYIVDMRDGWLDEPLKPLLYRSVVRRWQEKCLESRILIHAKSVQVTNEVWKDLLVGRYPALANRVHVLTNGYPQRVPGLLKENEDKKKRLLIHGGRFVGSRLTQLPNLLLEPLLEHLSRSNTQGVIQLIGPLSEDEMAVIEPFKPLFRDIGWIIECPGSLPREQLLDRLASADGLLLLSVSKAAIPSKLFEYIPAQKPIFVVTEKNSAVWKICGGLPQAKLIEVGNVTESVMCPEGTPFLGMTQCDVPEQFSESFLKRHFYNLLAQLSEK